MCHLQDCPLPRSHLTRSTQTLQRYITADEELHTSVTPPSLALSKLCGALCAKRLPCAPAAAAPAAAPPAGSSAMPPVGATA